MVRAAMVMLLRIRFLRRFGDLATGDRSSVSYDGEIQRADYKQSKPESWIANHMFPLR